LAWISARFAHRHWPQVDRYDHLLMIATGWSWLIAACHDWPKTTDCVEKVGFDFHGRKVRA
jgi:hypothetical protein